MAEIPKDYADNSVSNTKDDNISNKENHDENGDKNKSDINNCDEREATRRQFYKNRIRKDNIKLEMDESAPQEERRRILLEYQKQRRDELINAARGISRHYFSKEEEEGEGEEGKEDYEEYMDVDKPTSYSYNTSKESKISKMMLSEWMLDVPQDLTENWVMVPCPTGHRVRVISGRGETRAYSRRGDLHGIFPSALPGGHPDSDFHHSAAVDCIWIKSRKLFYIIDVLYWSVLPFMHCEAEFRLFWIKNKFKEIPQFKERDTKINKFPILTLQNINCNLDMSLALTELNHELYPLDGLLFYHRKAFYTYGNTPLVTWLKPFMLSEVLGIFVPSPLDKKPDDYINFEYHVQKVKSKIKQKETTKIVTNAMEIESESRLN